MFFNSLTFLVFFALTSTLYFTIPGKFQRYFLILISIVFYSFYIPWHIIILVFLVIFNYFSAISIGENSKKKKHILILSIIINIGILFSFKYLNLITSQLHYQSQTSEALNFLMPLGISFYTLKNIGYNIDIYRGVTKAETEFDIFALYIVFYPVIPAGPIERPFNFINQLRSHHEFDYGRVTDGLKLIVWGYFQKLVIADRLAAFVKPVYDNPSRYEGLDFVTATFFFAIQIFCDFSAYSDIAIGVGQVLGFKLTRNFNKPYFASSVSEFWRRWHITFSKWLRDYLFLPFAYFVLRKLKNRTFMGIRVEYVSYSFGVLFTMLLAGLWHGTNLTFLTWGLILALFMIISRTTKRVRSRFHSLMKLQLIHPIYRILSIFITFLLISLSWIFFRADNLGKAIYIIKNLHSGLISRIHLILVRLLQFDLRGVAKTIVPHSSSFETYLTFLFIASLIAVNLIQTRVSILELVSKKPVLVKWVIYLTLIFAILLFGKFESREFIYLRF